MVNEISSIVPDIAGTNPDCERGCTDEQSQNRETGQSLHNRTEEGGYMNISNMKSELKRLKLKQGKAKGIKQKALEIIETLTCNDNFSENEPLATIYKLSHVAVGHCGNKHGDWAKELDRMYAQIFSPQQGNDITKQIS